MLPDGFVEAVGQARHVCVLTGAGISAESGIPTFREAQTGLWEKYDPLDLATPEAFAADPELVWRWYDWRRGLIAGAAPNAAHSALAAIEDQASVTVITQNVDGLHQMAGNSDVIEFHGNMAWQRCMACDTHYKTSRVEITEIPPRCDCGGILRPNAVLFGEMIPQEALWRSRQVATDCDVMLVIGTSAVVQPAALMPVVAKESGAKVIEINPERTPLTGDISDYLIKGTAGDVMNRIMANLERLL